MFRKTLTNLIAFSKNERIGIYLLLMISTGIWILPVFFSQEEIDLETIKITRIGLDSTTSLLAKQNSKQVQRFSRGDKSSELDVNRRVKNPELFSFNPNKISADDWILLGLTKKNALTIQKYLSKGGTFRNKEDLKKIYGVPENLIESIMPYAVFDAKPLNSQNKVEKIPTEKKSIHLDLNVADSTALTLLPGIGEKLASRIIKYRNKLGGFVKLNQLLEVYGLKDSVLNIISPMLFLDPNFPINKININTVDYPTLSKHPYASFSFAKIIIAYRKSHGRINGVDEFYNIAGIPRENLDKLIPYCFF